MELQEIIDRGVCGDARVFYAVQEMKKNDKSFTEKENVFSLLLGGIKYNQVDVREIWFQGITVGLSEGLRIASLDGQKIDIMNSCKNERHKEFYNEFLKLSEKYNCAIQYHPVDGMCIIDLNRDI